MIRTVLGDLDSLDGFAYLHEHLVIDSPLIADRFPHIHLHDVEAAVLEVTACRDAGVALMLDAMPLGCGRDVVRLAEISRRTGVAIVASTGLHHDRYYGPRHWTNRVDVDDLAELFVAELLDGIDEFDATGPIIRRSAARAGIVKVATSGERLDDRDRRVLAAAALASVRTGAPVLTHCEGGRGGHEQIDALTALGLPPSAIILSHVDKTRDLSYLESLAERGVSLELDQGLREADAGADSITIRAVVRLVGAGYGAQIVLGTDGARRDLWRSLGGSPGLDWLARELPERLTGAGLDSRAVAALFVANPEAALSWREAEMG